MPIRFDYDWLDGNWIVSPCQLLIGANSWLLAYRNGTIRRCCSTPLFPVLALTHRSSSSSVSPTLFTHSLSSLAAIERLCAAPLKRAGAGQLSLALCRRSSSSETVLLQCCSAQLSWDQSEEDARPWRTHSGFAKLVPSLVTAKSGQFFCMRRALANWILFQNCSLLRTSDRVGRPFSDERKFISLSFSLFSSCFHPVAHPVQWLL